MNKDKLVMIIPLAFLALGLATNQEKTKLTELQKARVEIIELRKQLLGCQVSLANGNLTVQQQQLEKEIGLTFKEIQENDTNSPSSTPNSSK